jgi:hypothetical protein
MNMGSYYNHHNEGKALLRKEPHLVLGSKHHRSPGARKRGAESLCKNRSEMV